MSAAEKEGIVLDSLAEKPWDKEKRLADTLAQRAKNAGKNLLPDVLPLLFERLGMDPALLVSEMDKLICYSGDQLNIAKEDVLAISPASRTSTLWHIAEEVIWEGAVFPELDPNAFHALIPALRNQLHLGLTLASLIEQKYPSDQWNQFLPKLWPKTLEKRSSQAARIGSLFFEKGLAKLLHIELLSRTSSTHTRALLDLFQAKLHVR
jgi:DNA polymerase III delta subunit